MRDDRIVGASPATAASAQRPEAPATQTPSPPPKPDPKELLDAVDKLEKMLGCSDLKIILQKHLPVPPAVEANTTLGAGSLC